MIRQYISVLMLCLLAQKSFSEPDIPVVPVSVIKTTSSLKEKAALHPELKKTHKIVEEPVLTMKPGINEVVSVSIGHPNRIVTPFSTPEVISTSLTASDEAGGCGEICIKENVIYVATDKNYPVTLFITEKGNEGHSLSLTLVPKKIPPREIQLKLHGQHNRYMSFSKKAESWERSTAYVETLRSLFRKLALNEVPQGYTLNQPTETLPHCEHPGMKILFEEGQLLVGHSLEVFVGTSENISGDTLEFQEGACGDWNVAAVTTWPLKVLEPGQITEVYVARKRHKVKKRSPSLSRPSLVGDGSL